MTITQFREVEETLQIAGGMSAFWTDGEFSWTPSSYGNAEYVIVPQTTVWTPKLVLLNSVGTLKPMGLGNELSVTIDYNGSMAVSFGEVLSSKCSTNIYKFPFDSQTCELEFAAWGVYARDIRLKGVSEPIDLSFFTPNSDWELISNILTSHPSTGYSIFMIELTLKRSPLYYTVIESAKMNFLLKFIGQKWHRGNTITQVMPLCNDAEKDNVNCKTEIFITWKDVCNGLDNTMMVIAYSATVILICAYFITISL
ncbi:unnamed protein product [Mytilus edulis]|uniref:Neurotransmitter-gated ion-channel ligand-binding domain-containing protein n=1 Tax=Mytilus edulis TaxID=6550 RepID=A0A8S3TPH8_MYTED|nr:unnamed protein product [Mytilus edulis]